MSTPAVVRPKRYYTWDDCDVFVKKAAASTVRRYGNYVEYQDMLQEGFVWLLENQDQVAKWLGHEPQQTTRVYRSVLGQMTVIAGAEKARRVGYDPEDMAWYSPTLVEGLLPLAMDSDFAPENTTPEDAGQGNRRPTRPANEGGNLLAMVVDVRRAVEHTNLARYFTVSDKSDPQWEARIEQLVDFLGGRRPHVGHRRPLSNTTAQAITHNQEAG